MFRKHLTILGFAAVLTLGFSGTQAKADEVFFRFTGGRWSHSSHTGWHRYWGGPSIGFYFAPEPCYLVDGYDDPYYYSGPEYWRSRPSVEFGITLGGRDRYDRGARGGFYDRRRDDYRDSRYRDHDDFRGDRNYGRTDRGYSGSGRDRGFSDDRQRDAGGSGHSSDNRGYTGGHNDNAGDRGSNRGGSGDGYSSGVGRNNSGGSSSGGSGRTHSGTESYGGGRNSDGGASGGNSRGSGGDSRGNRGSDHGGGRDRS